MIISVIGCGWLGTPLARVLVEQGHQVIGTTKSPDKFEGIKAAGAEPRLFDLERFSVDPVEHQRLIDSDIIFLNTTSKSESAHSAFIDLILGSKSDAPKKLIFISSTSVLKPLEHMITEFNEVLDLEHPLVKIETMLRECSGLAVTVIRFAGLFGPGRDPAYFHPKDKIIQCANQPVNMIHLEDCLGMIKEIIKQNVWGEHFNCAAPSHPTKREFYSSAALAAGMSEPEFHDECGTASKLVSSERFVQKLNYQFHRPDLLSAFTL